MQFIEKAVWFVLLGLAVLGCSSKSDIDKKMPPTPPGTKIDQSSDFTGLLGVLNGKWAKKKNDSFDTVHSIEFTDKSIEEKLSIYTNVGKYEKKDDLIHITDRRGRVNVYGVEFLSDSEIAIRPEKLDNSFCDFDKLWGHWYRVSKPITKVALGSSPIAAAKLQVKRIEQKFSKNEDILNSAITDRDEYATKLRSLGVNTVADLKGNIRGQRLAENLVKLANEINSLERYLAVIDTELLKAKSLVRRLEQEEAGLTEKETQVLLQQLREAEERTDIVPLPTTPVDVDAAVEKALKALPTTPKKKK